MEYRTTPIIPDDQLIQYFVSSDPKALETLVYLNKDKIYKSIFSVIQDKHQADEIFRTVFIRIIDSMMAGKSIEEGKFLPLAMGIANNICIEHLRKIKYAPIVQMEHGARHETIRYIQPDAGQAIMNHEQHDQIRRMINLLPDEEREVIVLRHYADLSFKEIADILKCTISKALEKMRYALTILHRIMQEKQVVLNV